MRKTAKTLTSAALVCSLLAACGQDTLDSRQIDTAGGLAYKHGSDDPFTGTVAFKDTIPNNLENYWTTNIASTPGRSTNAQDLTGCEEHFAKGLVDGDAFCTGTGGDKAFTLHYADEQFDGPSKLYNPETGALVKSLNWSSGKLNGETKIYTYDGKQLVSQVPWNNGQADGAVKAWNTKGEQVTDAVFKNGQIDSGTVGTDDGSTKISTEFREGKPNGQYTKLTEQGDVVQKGTFVGGLRDGAWEDRDLSVEDIIVQVTTAASAMPVNYHDISNATRVVSHWSSGKMNGEMQGWDKDGKLFFDFHFVNGVLEGPNQVVTRDTGTLQTFNLKGGQLASDAPTPEAAATATQEPQQASEAPPSGASSINSPAEALTGSVQLPGTGNKCLDDWETAYRKERGADAVVAYDQIDEWTDECKQGKTAPKN